MGSGPRGLEYSRRGCGGFETVLWRDKGRKSPLPLGLRGVREGTEPEDKHATGGNLEISLLLMGWEGRGGTGPNFFLGSVNWMEETQSPGTSDAGGPGGQKPPSRGDPACRVWHGEVRLRKGKEGGHQQGQPKKKGRPKGERSRVRANQRVAEAPCGDSSP